MKKKYMTIVIMAIVLVLCVALSACDISGLLPIYTSTPGGSLAESTIELANRDTDSAVLSWADVAEAVIPSVVCVFNYADTAGLSLASTGSGVVCLNEGGNSYIVTNAHVVEDQKTLRIKTEDFTEYTASLVGSDSYTDLAVIMVEDVELPVAIFGDSSEMRIAEEVIAIGNPGGEEFSSSVTKGIVSAFRELSLTKGYLVECVQTDAAINPGNSGGALVNQYGQVIGINSAKISADGYEGMGFAISTAEMLPIVNSLLTTGTIENRASLGIAGTMTTNTYQYYNYPTGFLVTTIYSEKTAESGLQMYDIITIFDGQAVTTSTLINSILQNKAPDDVVSVTVYRPSGTTRPGSSSASGSYVELEITLSDYNDIQWED